MPILKVTVWDESESKRKQFVCASEAAALPSRRKNLAAVVNRMDTLQQVKANRAFIILDIKEARPDKDYDPDDWIPRG